MQEVMPIIIKRYRNRKLYNTQTKRYITLEEIEGLVKQQQEIKVIENDSGNDITATTLSQIIFDQGKNQSGPLPVNLLLSLVQSGGKRFDEIRRNIFLSLNFNHQFNSELERRINLLITSGELTESEGKKIFTRLVELELKPDSMVATIEGKIFGLLREQQIPTREDLQLLINRLDDLSRLVEGMSPSTEKNNEQVDKTQSIE